MNTWKCGKTTVLIGILTLVLMGVAPDDAAAQRGRSYGAPSGNELVFEGGAVEPLGDQGDDFFTTEAGFGATTGYELGLRYRAYISPNWSISPSFHYARFGESSGVTEDDNLGFTMRLSNYRYGLDLQTFIGALDVAVRPFLTGGVALINNQYRDQLQYTGTFKTSMNAFAYSAGVGLKIRHIEISGVYNWNQFDSANLSPTPQTVSYNWDYAVVRVGFAFGRY